MKRARWIVISMCVLAASACGSESGEPDAGTPSGSDAAIDASSPQRCERPSECDDGRYCNGVERCVDAVCVAGSPPCEATEVCLEERNACEPVDCSDGGDADGDNHRRMGCAGGDDCDDNDGNRYPGNTEVCDAEGHDEDCDPTTYGVRDQDGDGEPDAACCNGDVCGSDCDDTRAGIGPHVPEVCGDGTDNDCDGAVDEGVARTCYADGDRDGYAPAGAATMTDCSCPSGWTETEPVDGAADCNDDPAMNGDSFFPGAPELCDRLDNDCSDGATLSVADGEDHDDDGHSPLDAACSGGFPKDDCQDDHPGVYPGQAAYSSQPYCPRADCDRFLISGVGWVCDCDGTTPQPRFDYDCDGVQEPRPAHVACGTAGAGCDPEMTGQCLGEGPESSASESQCGQPVDYVRCSCEPSGAPMGGSCIAMPDVTRLPCR